MAGVIEDDRKSVINLNARPSYLDNGNPSTPESFNFDSRVMKRLSDEFADFAGDNGTEHIKTYLRLRPTGRGVNQRTVFEEAFFLLDEKTLLVRPPNKLMLPDSRESTFTYSRVFGPGATQAEVYDECARCIVTGFLEGDNGLIFGYGATNSGKTYTMQGYGKDFGIIPRTLEQLFSRVDDCLYRKGDIKPYQFDSYIVCDKNMQKINAETRHRVLREAKIKPSDMSSFVDSILRSSSSSVCSSGSASHPIFSTNSSTGTEEESLMSLPDKSLLYSIWVSFAEVYNERVYDLFDTVTRGKTRRRELKILQDKNGHVYIKDLTECCVNTAEEAYQFFLAGKQNLQFASTNVNSNSSRSHSFFNIRMVVIGKVGSHIYPKEVRRFSFCDLAGLERTSQTGNVGARLKESGTINQSLIVLLRCIRALREKQKGSKIDIIPYRDSKLTRLFQSYLTSASRISMIVNINPDPEMLDSTVQVIQNSAIASAIRTFRRIEPPSNDTHFSRKVRMSIRVALDMAEESSEEDETPRVSTVKQRKDKENVPPFGESNNNHNGNGTVTDKFMQEQIKIAEDQLRHRLFEQYNDLMLRQKEHYEKLLKAEVAHAANFSQQRVNLAVAAVREGLIDAESSEDSEDSSPSSPNENFQKSGGGVTVRRHTLATPEHPVRTLSVDSIESPDTSLQKKYQALLEEHQNMKSEMSEMESMVHALTAAKADKSKKLKAALVENENLSARVAASALEIKNLRDLVSAKDKQIVSMQQHNSVLENKQLYKQVEILNAELEVFTEKEAEMNQELKDAEKLCCEYDFKLRAANTKIEELTSEINDFNHKHFLLQEDKNVLHVVIDDLNAKIEKLTQEKKENAAKSPLFRKPHPVHGSALHSPGSSPSSSKQSDRPRRVTAKYSMNGPPPAYKF